MGTTADMARIWPKSKRMIQNGHRPASHVAAAKSFCTPIKALVEADTMLAPGLRDGHEAAGVSERFGWGGGLLAARCARATGRAAGGRLHERPVGAGFRA